MILFQRGWGRLEPTSPTLDDHSLLYPIKWGLGCLDPIGAFGRDWLGFEAYSLWSAGYKRKPANKI